MTAAARFCDRWLAAWPQKRAAGRTRRDEGGCDEGGCDERGGVTPRRRSVGQSRPHVRWKQLQ